MEFKRKTIIWEDNNEPPKNYIWVKSDGIAYEFNYVTNKWEESDLIPKKDEQEEEQIDEFIQECADAMIAAAQIAEPDQDIENLNDLKEFIKDHPTLLDDLLASPELIQQIIEHTDATVVITGDEEPYKYILKAAEIDESTGIPTFMELISVNQEHYDQLIDILTKNESAPEVVLRSLDFPITKELRYSSMDDLHTNNVLYDSRDIDYSLYGTEGFPQGSEGGTYYCLYGYMPNYDINNSTFLQNIELVEVTSVLSQIDFAGYKILLRYASHNVYNVVNISDFITNRRVYKAKELKYNNADVYLVEVVPNNWSAGVFIPITYEVVN